MSITKFTVWFWLTALVVQLALGEAMWLWISLYLLVAVPYVLAKVMGAICGVIGSWWSRATAERPEKDKETRPRIPDPSPEEKATTAWKRYQTKLRLLKNAGLNEFELNAAKEKAKQQYLTELDEALK
ncbi:MAG: hypothetical protein HYR84_01015 [Planctomycetes bacterium]|nr:hypothetical protein [Planctomycetota bacterium]